MGGCGHTAVTQAPMSAVSVTTAAGTPVWPAIQAHNHPGPGLSFMGRPLCCGPRSPAVLSNGAESLPGIIFCLGHLCP